MCKDLKCFSPPSSAQIRDATHWKGESRARSARAARASLCGCLVTLCWTERCWGGKKHGFFQRFSSSSSSSSSWTRAGAAVKPHSHTLCSSRRVPTPRLLFPRPPSCWGSLGAPLQELGVLPLFQRGREAPFSLSKNLLDVSFHDPQRFPASGSQPGNAELALEPLPPREFGIFYLGLRVFGSSTLLWMLPAQQEWLQREWERGWGVVGGILKHFLPGKENFGAGSEISGAWLGVAAPLPADPGSPGSWRRAGGSHPPPGFPLHGKDFRVFCGLCVPLIPTLGRQLELLRGKNNFREFICRIPPGFGQ